MRARERRIELDRALGGLLRLLVATHVAEHEAQQVVRVRVVRSELDRPLQRIERFIVEPAIVEDLADVELDDRAGGIERERSGEPPLRRLEIAAPLLREAELDDRPDVVRIEAQQLAELGDGIVHLPEQRIRAAELPAGVAVVGLHAQAVAQLRHAPVVVARVEVRDLEVPLRHLHLGVELERARERGDRLAEQALVVVQDAEVVVGAGVGRVDAFREAA